MGLSLCPKPIVRGFVLLQHTRSSAETEIWLSENCNFCSAPILIDGAVVNHWSLVHCGEQAWAKATMIPCPPTQGWGEVNECRALDPCAPWLKVQVACAVEQGGLFSLSLLWRYIVWIRIMRNSFCWVWWTVLSTAQPGWDFGSLTC